MKIILTYLKWPTIISTLLVSPFMILEWVNRRAYHEEYPFPLFGLLWLLQAAFFLILMPIVRKIRAGNEITARPIGLLLRVTLLILIAWLWTGTILDQMPCFLGVPTCD